MMTMSPEKISPSKRNSQSVSYRENIESCEVTHREHMETCEITLNTSNNEIGGEFEYEKCKGSNINKI